MTDSSARRERAALGCWLLLALVACEAGSPEPTRTRAELLDPQTCKGCHPVHYEQWSSSMHTYASEDPVFVAMNRRGQEDAQLGEFCVRCHAPMALLEGATKDGLNLDDVPEHLQGVTCYFCHNAVAVEGDHDAMLKLANDTTMRGGIHDPVDPGAHRAEYSPLHDRNDIRSSQLCGACHDIVTPKGVHLERTFAEYSETLFAREGSPGFDTCQGCHMPGRPGVVAVVAGVPARRLHEHVWPAVDIALTDFPHRAALRAAVEECELPNSVQYFSLEHDAERGSFVVRLETSAGHSQPSGSAQDRRMWLEVVAYDAEDKVILRSGQIADDEIEERPEDSTTSVWMFHEQTFDERGERVHMFWEAAPSELYPEGYADRALPGARSAAGIDHSLSFNYQLHGQVPRRMEFRLRVRPIGLDVLQDLVDSGHLAKELLAEMPTFTAYSAVAEWAPGADDPNDFTLTRNLAPYDCERYRCLYDPSDEGCE